MALAAVGLAFERPSAPCEIAVTSACASVMAGGILGLGYVLAGTLPGSPLHDPAGIFRNIRLTSTPFYDPEKQPPSRPVAGRRRMSASTGPS